MNDYSVGYLLGNRIINNEQEMNREYDDRQQDYIKSYSEIFQEAYGKAGDFELEVKYTFDSDIEKAYVASQRGDKIEDEFEAEWQNKSISNIIDEINDGNLKNVISDNVPVESDIIFDFKPTEFLKGILEVNDYSNLFFSKENIKAIDDTVRYKIKKDTDKDVSSIITNELFIIMRSIYLQYSKNISKNDVVAEVKYLNSLVVKEIVDKSKIELSARDQYLSDIDPNNANPLMNRPTNTTSAWRNYTYDFTSLI